MTDENNKKEALEETPGSHEYDGIKELNNPAPNWILIILMGSVFFSLIYLVHYFGYPDNKKDQVSEYELKSEQFDKKIAANNPNAGGSEISLEEMAALGKTLYSEKGCIACHGTNGEGNAIGPNLTDNYWINGCSTEDIVKIITDGKPAKGMTPYKSMMTQDQIKNLTAYIENSLVGSNPANGKEAQGEVCE